MGIFFVYILKASVCLALFYLFYRLLLSRETFHRFNRVALLGILLLSLLLPLIEITVARQTEIHQTMLTWEQLLLMADHAPEASVVVPVSQEEALSWIESVLLLYLAGIVFFTCRHFYSLARLLLLVRSGRREKLEQGAFLIVHSKEIAPFSWMKYILLSEKDLEENGREILIHERAHIRNRHSVDLLIAEVCIFFQWFNPAAWLLKQELQNIHEYEADESVIREGVNAKQYQLLLIKKAVGTRLYSMANSFNHSSLKKRITMMLKEKSNPWARLKYLYVLPLAAIAVSAFARPEVSHKAAEISAVKVNDLAAIVETKVQETVHVVLKDTVKQSLNPEGYEGLPDQMAQFPGGETALKAYLAHHRVYPPESKKAGTQGRVILQFMIEKDGTITAPSVIRSVDSYLDKEALRLIKAMPKWVPAKWKGQMVSMKYTLPVTFNLSEAKVQETVSEASATSTTDTEALSVSSPTSSVKATSDALKQEPSLTIAVGTYAVSATFTKKTNPYADLVRSFSDSIQNHPLMIVDGKETPYSSMEADRIDSITVLKGSKAMSIYGERGKNGVILIILKKNTEPRKKTEIFLQAPAREKKVSIGSANRTMSADSLLFNGQLAY